MENQINFNVMQALQFISILLTGLLAGLFYGYDCSVIKGLGNLPNDEYIHAFQSINKSIQNPYFFVSFIGIFFVLPITTWLSYKTCGQATFYLLLSATIIYVFGVLVVTLFGNVILNEQLTKFTISNSTNNEFLEMRKAFEKPWNSYHRIRTIASIVSFSLTILSILKNKV